jgi:hypothetical protein
MTDALVEEVTTELGIPEDDVTRHADGHVTFYVPSPSHAEEVLDRDVEVLEHWSGGEVVDEEEAAETLVKVEEQND